MIIASETSGMNNHFFSPEIPTNFPADFGNLPAFQFSKFLSIPVHEFNLNNINNSSCVTSGNSTSDETDDHQMSVVDERKQRRMISNRESARRSRMRKQRHLDELCAQALRLRTENQNLREKLNQALECQERVVEENGRLKEEASDLRQMLIEHQLGDSFFSFGEFLEDTPCEKVHLSDESSNH